jgi:hypothetical protein
VPQVLLEISCLYFNHCKLGVSFVFIASLNISAYGVKDAPLVGTDFHTFPKALIS